MADWILMDLVRMLVTARLVRRSLEAAFSTGTMQARRRKGLNDRSPVRSAGK
jgi:hypothetical protein